ncbi:MAG: hypothetical protein EXQ96_10675 [Alphaproteobacteria bacterium]|nr:hypothetical protein [Alphaproteobacteria bacterium]
MIRFIPAAALLAVMAAAPAAAGVDQERLSRIFDGCGGAAAKACVGEVWDFADAGRDGRLTQDEITAFFTAIAEWGGERLRTNASVANGGEAAATRARAGAILALAKIGPLAAALLLTGFDQDRDGKLSRPEFFREFSEDELVGLILRAGERLPELLAGLVLRSLERGSLAGKDVTGGLGGGKPAPR